MRPTVEANTQTGEPFGFAPQPLLAREKVRYVGEPVALVVAETPPQALDAAERVVVDYRPLPAVITAAAATAPARRSCRPRCPAICAWTGMSAMRRRWTRHLRTAAHVVALPLDNHRIVTNPMEPRGGVGSYDARGRSLHVACLQPEHSRQPRRGGALAGRAAGRGALHRARCRRRVRREEFHLCRACADAVGGEARWAAGEVDRDPQRGLPVRSPGTRSRGRGGAGAGCGGQVPGAAGRQHGESRRLHGGRRRRRADQPICASARHRLRYSGDRAAGRCGADQHHADRRHPRARFRRDGQHHGAADRCRRAAMRLRSRRTAPAQFRPRRRCR